MSDGRHSNGRFLAVLKERYQITADPLSDFSTGTAQAFVTLDGFGSSTPLVALIVDPSIPCRLDALRALKGIETPGLMTLVEYGVVDWPPYSRKAMALIYERPLGGRIMAAMTSDFARIDGSELMKKVIVPIAGAMRQLAKHGLAHRAIRPTNMYWATAERQAIVLGDCAAAPPAFDQPTVVETIESALAHPAGRGNGSAADDLYAFGASMFILLQGRGPVSSLNAQDLIRSKITEGSFAAIVRAETIPIHLIEMIRGLLTDDPKSRWTQAALDEWIAGKRRPASQSRIEKRAVRGFEFIGVEYFSVRELAIAFCGHWDAAIPVVASGQLEQWLRRALAAEDMADAVGKAVDNAKGSPLERSLADDALLCRVCLILDPLAPIRLRAASVVPRGIGAMLAVTVANGTDVNAIARVFRREVQKAWLDTREPSDGDIELDGKLKLMAEYLAKPTLGNGIERVLYALNESMPCQSPLVAKEFVIDIRNLLPALDIAAKAANSKKAWPIDRHVAAFIGARTTFDIERQMSEIADSSSERSVLGMLNLLATLQWRLGPKALGGLAGLVAGLVKPILNGYHSQRRRRDLERNLEEPAGRGDLVAMFRLLDDPDERAKDRVGYDQASREWHHMADRIDQIDRDLSNHDDKAADAARRASALISMGLALATVVALAVMKQ
ncbi:MAG TPA: hypothetical protein VGG27_12365 [Magnetospirillaceae bacterium]|jgi:hypothetical protein